MADPARTIITRAPPDGDEADVEQLFSVLYHELREIARWQRRRWREDYTLNTTALLHEAYVKLADQSGVKAGTREHFLALASRAMRHILCNYARDRRALKRGGSGEPLELDERATATPAADDPSDTLASLDDALRRLEEIDPRQSRVVECRFFGGLTVEETAVAMGISPRTVKRDWAMAQAWLHREMTSQ